MKKALATALLPLAFLASGARSQEELPPLDWEKLSETRPWIYTEVDKDVPAVEPGRTIADAPSDAIVLFDGSDLSEWEKTPFGEGVRMDRTEHFLAHYRKSESAEAAAWKVEDGAMIAGMKQGSIATKRAFGDMQLHIEWMVPVLEGEDGQNYGNSGIFLMGLYELQVLNSHENETYANGQAGSLYKQHVPLVNASKAPGQWQSYDILFTAPRFSEKGTLVNPALVTVLHNGVLIQHNAVLEGPTVFIGKSYYAAHPPKLPIVLQDHDNPVRFRNIWAREL